jgi:very-short-patch-repair endonuclease
MTGRVLPKTVRDALSGAESVPEAVLLNRLARLHLPVPRTQGQIIQGRKYRFDATWPEFKVAVEVQGGQWTRGRHNRAAGYESDAEKSALAQIEGWIVLAVTPSMINKGLADFLIRRALEVRGWC